MTETVQAQQKQERFKSILEATTDVVAMADKFGRLFYMNRAGRDLLGLGPDESLGETRLPDVHVPWAANLVGREGLPLAMLEGTWRGETAVRDRFGGELPASELILAHKSPDGTVDFVSAIIRDMSEQKEAEALVKASLEEKVVLLEGNSSPGKKQPADRFQPVAAPVLLHPRSGFAEDFRRKPGSHQIDGAHPRAALPIERSCENRFPRISAKLAQHGAFRESGPRPPASTRGVEVDPVSLDLDTAIPVGLITNELVTNALKYAFTGRTTGEILVKLSAAGPDEYTLCVSDNGVGLPKGFSFQKATSLGLRLVRILTKQMRGSLEVVNGRGTEFHINFKSGVSHE